MFFVASIRLKFERFNCKEEKYTTHGVSADNLSWFSKTMRSTYGNYLTVEKMRREFVQTFSDISTI
jgi:hypothetical protein